MKNKDPKLDRIRGDINPGLVWVLVTKVIISMFSSWSRTAVAASGGTRVSTAWAGWPSLQLSLHTNVTVARHEVFSCLPTRHGENMILVRSDRPRKKITMCIALLNKLQNCHSEKMTVYCRVCRDPPQPLVCVCVCTTPVCVLFKVTKVLQNDNVCCETLCLKTI